MEQELISVSSVGASIPQEIHEKAAAVFAERVYDSLGEAIQKIILYGSVARGLSDIDSDIDVVIIGPDVERHRSQISSIRNDVDLEYNTLTSLILLNFEQLNALAEDNPSFYAELTSSGKVLFGKLSKFEAHLCKIGIG